MNEKKSLSAAILACLFVLICAIALRTSISALAQEDQITLDVRTSVADDSFDALRQRPVMVSVIRDGEVVKQTEALLNSNARFSLPGGLYDLRLEGDGMITLVKRGIHVTSYEKTSMIGGPMRAGSGVKTIEYATGGLSREEIAARVAKLEAAVAELMKARQK